MIPQAPWTNTGALQQEISTLKSELSRKANNHEIYEINSRVSSLEHTLGNLSSSHHELLSRMQEIQPILDVCKDLIEDSRISAFYNDGLILDLRQAIKQTLENCGEIENKGEKS